MYICAHSREEESCRKRPRSARECVRAHSLFYGRRGDGCFLSVASVPREALEYLKTVICGRCGAYGRYQVYMTYMYFSFIFLSRFFKWNRRFFVEMSCCGAVYELDPEVGKRLLRGEEVEITESDLTLRQDGNGNPWTGSDASHRHKVCPSCGFETDEDFSYCPKCGKPL